MLTLFPLEQLFNERENRKRTQSLQSMSSMSVMMKEDSQYGKNEVVCKSKAALFKELTCMVMQSSSYIKTLPEVDLLQLEQKKVLLCKNSSQGNTSGNKNILIPHLALHNYFMMDIILNVYIIDMNKKTMIFDMDETLIHKLDSSDKCTDPDMWIEVPIEDNQISTSSVSATIKIGVNIRPYAIECLKEANKYFEVIVFTAGTKNYANAILDKLDPTGELIQHRLYRDSCVQVDADGTPLYIKDLRIFENRELSDIVIVDNAVISFAYQIDNGIPILPFREDKGDVEFLHLMNIMKDISLELDCRDFVKKAFKLNEIMKTDMDSYIHYYDMSESDSDLDDDMYLDMLAQAQRSLSTHMQKKKSQPKKKVEKRKKRISYRKCKKIKSECFKRSSKIIREISSPLSLEKNTTNAESEKQV